MMSPVPRRDSIELRGRASTVNSINGTHPDLAQQPHGLERVIESLKLENGDLKKSLRELDDRCIKPENSPPTALLLLILIPSRHNSSIFTIVVLTLLGRPLQAS